MTKPNVLVVDVQSCHKPGMCYVMFSRVQSLDQLNILKDLNPEKITVDEDVLKEAKRMWEVSVNRNPGSWEDRLKVQGLRVCSLNVRSLRCHIEDVRQDPVLQRADILFCQETWLTEEEARQEVYQLAGYRGLFVSEGAGKGIGHYVREGTPILSRSTFSLPHMQLVKICLADLEIINVYRSRDEPFHSVVRHLKEFISEDIDTLLVGDLNYCYTGENELSRCLQLIEREKRLGLFIISLFHSLNRERPCLRNHQYLENS